MSKVCVYAICKNEEKFVDRWMDNMLFADYVCVLDTGSTDGTYEKLKGYCKFQNVFVEQRVISPWRFDVARNESMKLIPKDADICVCVDLDEIFENKNWAKTLKNIHNREGFDRLHYPFVWQVNPDGSDGVVFYGEKIHSNRENYSWVHAVHEVLSLRGETTEKHSTTQDIRLQHFPDATKSRSSYLPLLELDVKERPQDDRAAHYLGREYFFRGEYHKAIGELKRHLAIPTATWADERAASMRYIGKSYDAQGYKDVAEQWFLRAIAEAPYLREGYVDYATMLLAAKKYPDALYFAQRALCIKERTMSYINSADAWGYAPYDIMAVALWYLGEKKLARENIDKALEYKPDDTRLLMNKELMKDGTN